MVVKDMRHTKTAEAFVDLSRKLADQQLVPRTL
jgi:hypothetical protein